LVQSNKRSERSAMNDEPDWPIVVPATDDLCGHRDARFAREPRLQLRLLSVVVEMGVKVSGPHACHIVGHGCRNPTLAKCGGEAQHLEKVRIGSPPGLSNVQSSTARPKTPHIGVFLVSLESSWSVNIENGLALAIWTSIAQVMGKRRAESQTGNLTPDHYKSGIDLFPTSELKVRYVVAKMTIRATSLV
jgi:hypothetical protein